MEHVENNSDAIDIDSMKKTKCKHACAIDPKRKDKKGKGKKKHSLFQT